MLKQKNLKILFLFLSIINISIWSNYFSSFERNLSIHFVDVGNGDGIFIKTPDNFKIVVDGGPKNKFSDYLGINFPFLNKDIDLLVLSHPHEDHILGAIDILKNYNVKKILGSGIIFNSPAYSEFLEIAEEKNIDFIVARQGQNLKYGNLFLEVVYPFEYLSDKRTSNINNSSLILKVKYNNFSCLLLGDVEKDMADEILFSGVDIDSDVVKVSHQGAKNGIQNVSKFLDTVSTNIAVISVGENNYGHPSNETLNKLNSYGINVKRTDIHGDIVIKSDGIKYWVDD
jgi:competence protein ComEC